MRITEHCFDRAKERYGLCRHSFERLVDKALETGKKQDELKGKLKRYVSALAKEYKSTPVIYGEYLFFFCGENLITSYQVPSEFKKYLKL